MKLTKYEHACLVIEKGGESLVIDPGDITDDFVLPANVVGIVLTHEHPDHVDPIKIQAIVDANPGVVIISHRGIIDANGWPNTRTVSPGDTTQLSGYTLEFFGGKHALIHESIPIIDNIGVMVNDTLYYPGDSYAVPNKPVKILAAPTSGPWLKLGEAIDFIIDVHPEVVFSTHDAHSSQKNVELVDRLVPMLLKDTGILYQRLNRPLEI